jgi:hypothetical protein
MPGNGNNIDSADDGTISRKEHDEGYRLAVKRTIQALALIIAATVYLFFLHVHTYILIGAYAEIYAGWMLYTSFKVFWSLQWMRKHNGIRD